MLSSYFFDQEYQNIDFTQQLFIQSEFEQCVFFNCNFNELDLSNFKFIECQFIECNLSNVQLNETSFQNVDFTACKMIGFNLEHSLSFALKVSFNNCLLNDSSFYQLELSRTKFIRCSLQNVDFSFTNLNNSFFDLCDFQSAIFDQTNLKQANLKTSFNFQLNPNENYVKNAIFSKDNLEGLLHYLNIKIQ